MYIPRLLREADPPAGGAGSVMDEMFRSPQGTLPDVMIEQQKQAAEAAQKVIDDAAAAETAKNAGTTNPPAGGTSGPVEGVNADGTLQDGYQKDATTGAVTKVPAEGDDKDDDQANDAPDAKAFYEEVAKLTGRPLEVEYPADVDPLSPAGIAHRDAAVREDAMLELENYYKEADPRAYAYMIHRQAGGSDDEFLGGSSGYVLPDKAAFEASADMQSAVYKNDLLSKGLEQDVVDAIVEKAIKENKLKERATAAYNGIQKQQADMLESGQKEAAERTKALETAQAELKTVLTSAIKTGLKFQIPEANQPEFQKFILDNIRQLDDGSFVMVQPVKQDTLTQMLDALFFQYKKGDLSQLVQKQAKTDAAQRLRLRTGGGTKGPGAGGGEGNNANDTITLGSLFNKPAG